MDIADPQIAPNIYSWANAGGPLLAMELTPSKGLYIGGTYSCVCV